MWPKDARAERRMVTGGGVAYTLYHATVGELGQILLQPLSTGGCQMTCEVLDRPDGLHIDPGLTQSLGTGEDFSLRA